MLITEFPELAPGVRCPTCWTRSDNVIVLCGTCLAERILGAAPAASLEIALKKRLDKVRRENDGAYERGGRRYVRVGSTILTEREADYLLEVTEPEDLETPDDRDKGEGAREGLQRLVAFLRNGREGRAATTTAVRKRVDGSVLRAAHRLLRASKIARVSPQ
jgi:hypothetical protein